MAERNRARRMEAAEENRKYQRGSARGQASEWRVDGNTVRRLEEPVRERPRMPQRPKKTAVPVRRNREKLQKISAPYLVLLAGATVMLLMICVYYLRVHASITTYRNEIERLETTLQDMRTDNSVLEARIESYIDLDHIYQVATEELGMKYPKDSQVIYYDKTESGYVRQYEDIPTD